MIAGSLDTNLLLRWIIADVPVQQEAVDRLLAKAEREAFYVGSLALSEFAFVCEKVYRLSRHDVVRRLEAISECAQLRLDRERLDAALELFAVHPQLSFTDCYLVAEAEDRGYLPLYTFDKNLAKKAAGRTKLPA